MCITRIKTLLFFFFAFINQSVYNARHIFTMRVISLTNYIWIYEFTCRGCCGETSIALTHRELSGGIDQLLSKIIQLAFCRHQNVCQFAFVWFNIFSLLFRVTSNCAACCCSARSKSCVLVKSDLDMFISPYSLSTAFWRPATVVCSDVTSLPTL